MMLFYRASKLGRSHVHRLSPDMEGSPDFSEVSSNVCSILMVSYFMNPAQIPLLVFGKYVASSRS
jgi:hypothetical protein